MIQTASPRPDPRLTAPRARVHDLADRLRQAGRALADLDPVGASSDLPAHLPEACEALVESEAGLRHERQKLRASEARYRHLVESASAVIWSIDLGGVITFVNGASETVLGLTPAQMMGRPGLEFLHGDGGVADPCGLEA